MNSHVDSENHFDPTTPNYRVPSFAANWLDVSQLAAHDDEPVLTKSEDVTNYHFADYSSIADFLKTDSSFAIDPGQSTDLDVLSDNLTNWRPSQDLMDVILGPESSSSGFDIRLDDDVFMSANKELESNVFGVHQIS